MTSPSKQGANRQTTAKASSRRTGPTGEDIFPLPDVIAAPSHWTDDIDFKEIADHVYDGIT